MKTKFRLQKITRYFLYTLLGVVFLTSCNKLEEGTIVSKWYEPEQTYVMIMPVVMSTGKTTTTMMIPYTIYDGEDYCIKIQGIDSDGDTVTRTLYVAPVVYDTLNLGQYICVDGNCSDEDLTYKKVRK